MRKKSQEIFFSNFNYGKPVPMHSEAGPIDLDTFQGSILLLTGIANPGPLKEYLYGHSQKVIHASFPDHHEFFDRDLSEIQKIFNNIADSEKIIITTEKDSIRLQKFAEKSLNISNTLKLIYYIPIEVCFLADGEKDFNRKIIDYVGKN